MGQNLFLGRLLGRFMDKKMEYSKRFLSAAVGVLAGYVLCVFIIGKYTLQVWDSWIILTIVELCFFTLYAGCHAVYEYGKRGFKSGFSISIYIATIGVVSMYVYYSASSYSESLFELRKGEDKAKLLDRRLSEKIKEDSINNETVNYQKRLLDEKLSIQDRMQFFKSKSQSLKNKPYATYDEKMKGLSIAKAYDDSVKTLKRRVESLSSFVSTQITANDELFKKIEKEETDKTSRAKEYAKAEFYNILGWLSGASVFAFICVGGMVRYRINAKTGIWTALKESFKSFWQSIFKRREQPIIVNNYNQYITNNYNYFHITENHIKKKQFNELMSKNKIDISFKQIEYACRIYDKAPQILSEKLELINRKLKIDIKPTYIVQPNSDSRHPIIVKI